MIKDWINSTYFDGESFLDMGTAGEAPEVKIAAQWNFIDGAGMQVWLEYVNPASGTLLDRSCTLLAVEAQDLAVFVAAHHLDCTLNATEAQDTALFSSVHKGTGTGEDPLYFAVRQVKRNNKKTKAVSLRLNATEQQDSASFVLEHDHTVDIVMALMMAAWEEEVSYI